MKPICAGTIMALVGLLHLLFYFSKLFNFWGSSATVNNTNNFTINVTSIGKVSSLGLGILSTGSAYIKIYRGQGNQVLNYADATVGTAAIASQIAKY